MERLTLERSYILERGMHQKKLHLGRVTPKRSFVLEKLYTEKNYVKRRVIP